MTGHDQKLSGGVDDIELAENGSGVRGQDHLLEMVDDDLVTAKGTEGGLDSRRDGPAGVDVAKDGAILGIVAVEVGTWLEPSVVVYTHVCEVHGS